MSEKDIDLFTERILGEINSAMSCLNLYVGHRLGLFKALTTAGPSAPDELAAKTGFNERYVREWLECMAANEYLDHDAKTGRFSLSPEYAPAFVDQDSPYYIAAFLCWLPSLSKVMEPLMEAFRSGGGVSYETYGQDGLEAIGAGNKPMFIHDYTSSWIPAMPDIKERLESGARVADFGCGIGWSSISLAKGFPEVHIDAVDADKESIERARANAQKEGVAGQIDFHVSLAENKVLEGPYDLVTAFECVHDMAYPVKALSEMRDLAGPHGTVFVGDEAVSDDLAENHDFMGRFCYNFSVLHCLPQAMIYPDSAGTGTLMGPKKLHKYASDAGFSKMDVIQIENPFWRFYRLTP